ncbi:DUF5807 family protein [Halobacterium zhouii]|uniref:DUF5807 family protein n=1 Tax=Halobacterium zhouii TaxID=2902624 RepID=UPI001E5347D5|nr:DUF5807 family protein [Halobacterium zhouii]
MSDYDAYLAGDRPDHVALYLSESYVSDVSDLANREDAERVDDGVVLVVDGERGRNVFQSITGMAAMDFSSAAMDNPGHVNAALDGGDCPAATDDANENHHVEFVFSFAEAENQDVGGLYAEGDVIHAYAYCACGETYSDKWIAGER